LLQNLIDNARIADQHSFFDQKLMNMDKSIQQYSDGERLEALTQIYVELSLPFQVAYRAAEADLCYHDEIC